MYIPRNPGLPPGVLLARAGALPPELGPEGERLLFARARMALSWAVAALGLWPGDVVLVPAYVTGSAVAPLLWAGLQLQPYAVNPATLEPHWPMLSVMARAARPHALLLVHYFGFPSDPNAARAFCDRHGLLLLEDCAHSLLTRHGGHPLGSHGDAAFYSLRKLLPLPDGGLLRLRFAGPGRLLPPPLQTSAAALLPLLLRQAAQALGCRPALRRAAAIRPVVADEVRLSEPARGIHPWSLRLLRRLDLPAARERRRANYRELSQRLAEVPGIRRLHPELPAGVCPQVLPLLVADAPGVAA
ncbi:MAG: hypothetical protein GX774_05610, partial [Armatimonadetes bacterium]|nr:hypothetical protein [Armatimonadota bacterium]